MGAREIHRILRSGGTAFICDYHLPDDGLGRLLLKLLQLVEGKKTKDMVRSGLLLEAQKIGFSASSKRYSIDDLFN